MSFQNAGLCIDFILVFYNHQTQRNNGGTSQKEGSCHVANNFLIFSAPHMLFMMYFYPQWPVPYMPLACISSGLILVARATYSLTAGGINAFF